MNTTEIITTAKAIIAELTENGIIVESEMTEVEYIAHMLDDASYDINQMINETHTMEDIVGNYTEDDFDKIYDEVVSILNWLIGRPRKKATIEEVRKVMIIGKTARAIMADITDEEVMKEIMESLEIDELDYFTQMRDGDGRYDLSDWLADSTTMCDACEKYGFDSESDTFSKIEDEVRTMLTEKINEIGVVIDDISDASIVSNYIANDAHALTIYYHNNKDADITQEQYEAIESAIKDILNRK